MESADPARAGLEDNPVVPEDDGHEEGWEPPLVARGLGTDAIIDVLARRNEGSVPSGAMKASSGFRKRPRG